MSEAATKEAGDQSEVDIDGGKFLIFFLTDEEYAIEILKVQEIIGLMDITPIPRMPDYIRGVLNLRGKIIPVMDLHIRFGLNKGDDTSEACIVVVQYEDFLMGVWVDKVSEVIDIQSSQIEAVPVVGAVEQCEYLAGIGKANGSVKMIIDVHKVLFDVPKAVLSQSNETEINHE